MSRNLWRVTLTIPEIPPKRADLSLRKRDKLGRWVADKHRRRAAYRTSAPNVGVAPVRRLVNASAADARGGNKSGHPISALRLSEAVVRHHGTMCLPIVLPCASPSSRTVNVAHSEWCGQSVRRKPGLRRSKGAFRISAAFRPGCHAGHFVIRYITKRDLRRRFRRSQDFTEHPNTLANPRCFEAPGGRRCRSLIRLHAAITYQRNWFFSAQL